MAKFAHHQRGFTLIEMSIVLVIIGLIVGGILKGQELIESSRQKNFISQIDRIKAGTTTFVDRFRAIPGDYSRITQLPNSGLLEPGNDNGVVGAVTTTNATVMTPVVSDTAENVEFFNHMLAAQLISGGSVVDTAPTCFAGLCDAQSPLPASAFPRSGLNLVYGTHGTVQPKQTHWLVASRWTTAAPATGTAILSPERAYQIDNKYDDGLPHTGNIRSDNGGNDCGTDAANTTYGATTTTVACTLTVALE